MPKQVGGRCSVVQCAVQMMYRVEGVETGGMKEVV